jgi:hypothetical protein
LYSKEKQEAERKRVEAQGIADYQRIISIGLTQNCSMSLLKHKRTSSITKHKKIIFMDGKDNASVISDK